LNIFRKIYKYYFSKISITMELNKNTTIRFLSVLLITCSVLLAGCFDLEVNQTINEDGTSKMEMVIDMTKTMEQMKAQMEQMSESMGGNASSQQGSDELTCDDFEEANLPEGAANPMCEKLGPYAIKVSYDMDLLALDALDIQESDGIKTYTFNMDDLSKLTSEDEGNGSSSSYSMNQMSPKDMGMTYIYTLTMPGEIIKSDIGLIEGNKVTIDVAEQYEQTKGLKIIAQVDLDNPYVPNDDASGDDSGSQDTGAGTGDDGTGSADPGKTGDEGTDTETNILDFSTWNSNMMIIVGVGAGLLLVIIIIIIVLAAGKGKKKQAEEPKLQDQQKPAPKQHETGPAKASEEPQPGKEERPAEVQPEKKPKKEPRQEEESEQESSDEEPKKEE
jgi:hypothetical protein